MEALGEIPAYGKLAIPQKLLTEGQGQLLTAYALHVALLQFVVVAQHLGIERDALRQPVHSQLPGILRPLGAALDLTERYPGLHHGFIDIVESTTPLVFLLIDRGLATGLAVGVAVGEREVSRVVGHGGFSGTDADTHIRQRQIGIGGAGDGDTLDGIALLLVGCGIECLVEGQVSIERIVFRTGFLFRH